MTNDEWTKTRTVMERWYHKDTIADMDFLLAKDMPELFMVMYHYCNEDWTIECFDGDGNCFLDEVFDSLEEATAFFIGFVAKRLGGNHDENV